MELYSLNTVFPTSVSQIKEKQRKNDKTSVALALHSRGESTKIILIYGELYNEKQRVQKKRKDLKTVFSFHYILNSMSSGFIFFLFRRKTPQELFLCETLTLQKKNTSFEKQQPKLKKYIQISCIHALKFKQIYIRIILQEAKKNETISYLLFTEYGQCSARGQQHVTSIRSHCYSIYFD